LALQYGGLIYLFIRDDGQGLGSAGGNPPWTQERYSVATSQCEHFQIRYHHVLPLRNFFAKLYKYKKYRVIV